MPKQSKDSSAQAISVVLRYGSMISTLIMAVGLGLLFLRGGSWSLAAPYSLRSGMLFRKLVRLDPTAVIELGILLLLFTPIFRIVAAILSFAVERETKYVLISLGVLAIILLSIIFAIHT